MERTNPASCTCIDQYKAYQIIVISITTFFNSPSQTDGDTVTPSLSLKMLNLVCVRGLVKQSAI